MRRFLSHINDRKRNAGIDVDEEAASLAIVIPDGQAGRSQEYQFRYYPSERRPTLCAPSFFESNINGVWQRQWLTPTILAHEIAHHAIFEITGYRASHRISCFRDSEVDRFRCRALVEDARPETRGISVVEGITDALAAYYTATPKFGYSNLGLDRGPMAYDISIDDESQPDVIRRRLALALWRMREEFERHARESRRVTVDEARSNLEFLLYRLLERNRCLVETDQMLEAGPCLLQELLDVDRDRNDSEFEDAIRLAFDGSLFARSRFTRGDVNEDGRVDISDVIVTLEFLFRSQGSLCLDAVDANDSGQADLADPIYVLLHLFQAGPAVPPPGDCGLDNTEDELFCTSFGACDAAE